jgi:hypothetical protein
MNPFQKVKPKEKEIDKELQTIIKKYHIDPNFITYTDDKYKIIVPRQ